MVHIFKISRIRCEEVEWDSLNIRFDAALCGHNVELGQPAVTHNCVQLYYIVSFRYLYEASFVSTSNLQIPYLTFYEYVQKFCRESFWLGVILK
jgi:hypothetical protein